MKLTATKEELLDADTGRCRSCGAEAYNVEPDATKYKCDKCGADEVFGLQELLLMGELAIRSEDE